MIEDIQNTAVEHCLEDISLSKILRCKVRVIEVIHVKNADGTTDQERVKLWAVTTGSEENKQWAKWTPSAVFELQISNPEAFGKLSNGHEFYVDFTPAIPKED